MDLVFENNNMIDLLNQRGLAISSHNESEIIKIEDKIHELKEKQYFTKICGAFITFEDYDTYVRARQKVEDYKLQMYG